MHFVAADHDRLITRGAHHLRQVQRQDRVIGAQRLTTQKLYAPGGFVARLLDERDVSALDDAQPEIQFGQSDRQLGAVLQHPGVDVAIGFGTEVAASQQLLQRPAGTVRQLGYVAVEPGSALVRGARRLVDLGECGEPAVVRGLFKGLFDGHAVAPSRVETGSVNIKCGTSISRSRPSRDWKRTVTDLEPCADSGCLSAQDHSTMTWPR